MPCVAQALLCVLSSTLGIGCWFVVSLVKCVCVRARHSKHILRVNTHHTLMDQVKRGDGGEKFFHKSMC